MTKRIICIGECMVEMSPQGGGLFARGFAGDTFNTAWYARQLGGPDLAVHYMTALGDDAVSAEMEAFFRGAGIVPEVRVIRGSTVGLYMISLKDGERSFSYWRNTSAARQMADDLQEIPGARPGDTLFFSGITAAILPPKGRANLLDALARAREAGAKVVFDPNLRPRLWPDTGAMTRAIMDCAAHADIALPSYEDEAEFFGDADKAATAERYLSAGAGLAVVKDGPGSVLIATPETRDEVRPDRVERPVDTTAAGDAFNAGFLVNLLRGATPAEAVRAGCVLSARVIAQPGALVQLAD